MAKAKKPNEIREEMRKWQRYYSVHGWHQMAFPDGVWMTDSRATVHPATLLIKSTWKL